MISVKYAIIIAVAAFAAGGFVMSPVPQAIAAVIATDVQCTGCVGTTDLAGNAVTAAKVKDGEIKAAEIATDAVGASELQGVTKLLFEQCVLTSAETSLNLGAGAFLGKNCNITGVDADDFAIATLNDGDPCFEVAKVSTFSGVVVVVLRNDCPFTATIGSPGTIGVMAYDK